MIYIHVFNALKTKIPNPLIFVIRIAPLMYWELTQVYQAQTRHTMSSHQRISVIAILKQAHVSNQNKALQI